MNKSPYHHCKGTNTSPAIICNAYVCVQFGSNISLGIAIDFYCFHSYNVRLCIKKQIDRMDIHQSTMVVIVELDTETTQEENCVKCKRCHVRSKGSNWFCDQSLLQVIAIYTCSSMQSIILWNWRENKSFYWIHLSAMAESRLPHSHSLCIYTSFFFRFLLSILSKRIWQFRLYRPLTDVIARLFLIAFQRCKDSDMIWFSHEFLVSHLEGIQ